MIANFYNNIDKKKFLFTFKISLLVFILILLVFLMPVSFSKFTSQTKSNAKAEVAFFLINADYQTENILLGEIIPKTEPYVYNFVIKNNKNSKRVETNLKYDLKIRTTTNLPLEYKLYLNQNYNDEGAENILRFVETKKDEDGTYFNYFTTNTKYFSYLYDEENTYQLLVYFPAEYVDYKYQDIYESIEISVDAKQIIDENN